MRTLNILSNLDTSHDLVGEKYTGHLRSAENAMKPRALGCPLCAIYGGREKACQRRLGLALWGYLKQNSFTLLPSSFLVLEAFHLVVLAVLLFHWLTVYIAPYVTELFSYNAAVGSLDA